MEFWILIACGAAWIVAGARHWSRSEPVLASLCCLMGALFGLMARIVA